MSTDNTHFATFGAETEILSTSNFDEAYHSYSLPDPDDPGDILKVMGSKINVTDNFSGGRILLDGLLIFAWVFRTSWPEIGVLVGKIGEG